MTILGNIFGRDIEKYDVVEISDDGGKTWQDYASITCPEDVKYVRKIIASQPAKYRIRPGDCGRAWQTCTGWPFMESGPY